MSAAVAVEQILERSGLSKSELSARSGVSRSLIDDYLKGRRQPSVEQLERLGGAAGLRLDIAWAEIEYEPRRDPSWLIPDNPDMRPRPLTIPERAKVIEMVCGTAMLLPAKERGPLEFPPVRAWRRHG